MKKLFLFIFTLSVISCSNNSKKEQKLIKYYYFVVAGYSYPEIVTSLSDEGQYIHRYNHADFLATSNISEYLGIPTEDEKYRWGDSLETIVREDVILKNDYFRKSASIYGIDTYNTDGKVSPATIHIFKTYKEASIARKMAINTPRDFVNSKKYYPEQQ